MSDAADGTNVSSRSAHLSNSVDRLSHSAERLSGAVDGSESASSRDFAANVSASARARSVNDTQTPLMDDDVPPKRRRITVLDDDDDDNDNDNDNDANDGDDGVAENDQSESDTFHPILSDQSDSQTH